MNSSDPAGLDPADAERRSAEMLDDAGLPRFDSSSYDPETRMLDLASLAMLDEVIAEFCD